MTHGRIESAVDADLARRLTHGSSQNGRFLQRKTFGNPDGTQTDPLRLQRFFNPAPRIIDTAFGALMAVEHAWLELGGVWAWGTSVFGVARKPAASDGAVRS